MPPSREDFARWLDDPVTRWVMQAHRAMADVCKETWDEVSWKNGGGSREQLLELRCRADTYLAIAEADYAALCDANGEQPNEE